MSLDTENSRSLLYMCQHLDMVCARVKENRMWAGHDVAYLSNVARTLEMCGGPHIDDALWREIGLARRPFNDRFPFSDFGGVYLMSQVAEKVFRLEESELGLGTEGKQGMLKKKVWPLDRVGYLLRQATGDITDKEKDELCAYSSCLVKEAEKSCSGLRERDLYRHCCA